jgi:hypothetical protein
MSSQFVMFQVRRRMLPAAIAAVAAVGAVDRAQAQQQQYPERQVTLIACFPAAGGTDIAARMINTQLGEALGKPVIVENRAARTDVRARLQSAGLGVVPVGPQALASRGARDVATWKDVIEKTGLKVE